MLRGIAPHIGPDLLAVLYRMGHGDELVLADAHFPGESLGRRVVRADGHAIPVLLAGILPLISLDKHGDSPAVLMAPVPGDKADPHVESSYLSVIRQHHPWVDGCASLDRQSFYERAARAFVVVISGDTTRYGNLIIRRGNDDL